MKTEKINAANKEDIIVNKIYFIRETKVMLDKDLAKLYGIQPKRMREQVKRNNIRFPEHFMFVLTEAETNVMVSQNAIPSKQSLGGALPLVFTEHGLLMLANVIKSDQAIQMSIKIIEVFVKLRQHFLNTVEIRMEIEKVKKKVESHSKNTELVFQYLDELTHRVDDIEKQQIQESRKRIGFKEK